ncbi:MAG: hypothetical protein PHW95_04370 [Patescibacteria group bacterium]|nr:hypothetical protein [Patescibacteria group bacterium]
MHKLLKILNIIFVALGIMFLAMIIILTYLFIADPFGLKPLFYPSAISVNTNTATTTPTETRNYKISPQQAQALKALGIDPTKLPSTISPKMQQCFINNLGEARTTEIINGAIPTPVDYLKTKSCLN